MWRYFIHIVFVVLSCHVEAQVTRVVVDAFSGYDGFKLGRYHRDAQFYLIHCSFAANMADQDIYLVPTTNTIRWGRRVYYYDCHKKGQEYSWYTDNLASAPGAPGAAGINPHWVFRDKWDPEKESQQ